MKAPGDKASRGQQERLRAAALIASGLTPRALEKALQDCRDGNPKGGLRGAKADLAILLYRLRDKGITQEDIAWAGERWGLARLRPDWYDRRG